LRHRGDVAEDEAVKFFLVHEAQEESEVWRAAALRVVEVNGFAEARAVRDDGLDAVVERAAQQQRVAEALILCGLDRLLLAAVAEPYCPGFKPIPRPTCRRCE
jgi:hypothetical protein